ncbi:hypothetical protein BDN72DRAFT_876800 [Pluteus cervinus]|uniref:Uncharacterized protein n=1 Tax=Pluteus cervinus TaxID=181527 RepID=A0ACD3B1U7_9AGAR|nr:hypothetical protein BDN72DRAFT_876800 [Pluteus cervinus]
MSYFDPFLLETDYNPFLLETFQYNPDNIRANDQEGEQQPNALPFDFYDRHLSPELSLKRVVIQPSLPQALTKNLDSTLEGLESRGMVPLALTRNTMGDFVSPTFSKQIHHRDAATAHRLAARYEFTLGDVAPPYISRWLLHPTAPKFYSALVFDHRGSNFSKHQKKYIISSSSLRFRPFEHQRPEVLSLVSDQLMGALRSLESKSLITYQFYPMSAAMDELFRDMGSLQAESLHAEYRTGGLPEAKAQRQPPCDAKNTPWVVPDCASQSKLGSPILPSSRKRVVPRPHESQTKLDRMDSQTAAGLCYHAWHRAVTEDATIILLHCGNYERIGIRHRATQTLILSDLIEVSKCQDPTYGKLHMGLMLASVQDALDRHWQSPLQIPLSLPVNSNTIDSSTKNRNKRKDANLADLRRSKRQKIKSEMASLARIINEPVKNEKVFWSAFAKCSIALIHLNFDELRSPSPAACLRQGCPISPYSIRSSPTKWRKSYNSLECCTLTLDSDLWRGGTGRIHTARLEFRTAGGVTHSKDVIVKSAVDPYLRKRIRREYDIYQHLWEHRVDRIPIIYGLFEDIDDLVTLLVIEKFQMSFRDREPADSVNDGMMLSITRAERSLCLKTVRDMHQAGVAHLDLRAENIMVGNDGLPVIIDFEGSSVGAEKWITDKEIEFLQDLLDGKTRDQFPIQLNPNKE